MARKFRYAGWRYTGNHPNGKDSVSCDERPDLLKMVGVTCGEEGDECYLLDIRLYEAEQRGYKGIIVGSSQATSRYLVTSRTKTWGADDFGYYHATTYTVAKYVPPMIVKHL